MYELLCGHTPFSLEKKDDIEILNQITSFRPVRSLMTCASDVCAVA